MAYKPVGIDEKGNLPDRARAALAAPIFALEMVKPYSFGDSYGKNPNQGADSDTLWVNRLAARHRMQALAQYAVAGTRMDEILSAIKTSWPTNGRGLVFFSDGCINDEKQYGDTSGTSTTAEAFRSALAYLTSRSVQGAVSSAFVYGPGWSNGTTSTVGAYADMAFSGGTAYLLVNFTTVSGGTLTVKNTAGNTVATVSTGGYKQNFTGAVRLSGLGTGDNTVRVSLSSGTATIAGLIVPSPTPPNIVWLKAGRFNSSSTEWSRLQSYEAACEAILSDFPTVIKVEMGNDWDYTSMISPDATHPNDLGVTYITNRAEAAIRSAITTHRQGLNQLTSSGNAGTYMSPTVSYVGSGATAPAQVTGFTATAGNQVDFAWSVPTDGGATLTGYVIQSSPAGANTWTTLATPAASATSYTVTSGLTASTSYDFRIAAVNSVGTGTYSTTATAAAGQSITTYASDTFSRSTLGSTEAGNYAWTTNNGSTTWSCNGSQLVCASGSAVTENDCYINDGQSDGTISVQRVVNNVNSGIAFRISGANDVNGYIFWLNGTTWTLSKRTASNSYTALGTSTAVASAANQTISVVLNGSSITCKVGGTTVITATDSSYTSTKHGVWANSNAGMTFDNFSHNSLTS